MLTIPQGVLVGTFPAPPSKSVTHRALVLAAHSATPCRIEGWLDAADPRATLAALEAFGAHVRRDGADVILHAERLEPPQAVDCHNAGTALRILMGLAARFDRPVRLTGDASLKGRPNAALIQALRAGGARIDSDDRAPLTVEGPIRPGDYRLPGAGSSQFATSLMLSLPFLDGTSSLAIDGTASSAPYLDITTRVAKAFGIETGLGDIPGGQRVRCRRYRVEGDWSGAAFPLVAAAITGGSVRLTGLDERSPQGDRAILDHLRAFGATVRGATVDGAPLVSPGTIDVRATPDLFPALCILAAYAKGTTRFTGGAALRHKESDRIAAMAQGLRQLGIRCDERPDGLTVQGGHPHGGTIDARDDHRIHMAFAIAGLAASAPVTVSHPASAAVSYPDFHRLLQVTS